MPAEDRAAARLHEQNARVDAHPLARALANARGVSLAALTGTGNAGRITVDDVRAHTSAAISPREGLLERNAHTPNASGAARALAANLGVDLADVDATGPAGQISPQDVRRHAAARRSGGRPLAAVPAASRFPEPKAEDVSPLALHGGADLARRLAGPEPTLFATGNLPPFTASGLDVAELMRVPWQARPALAAATTLGDALAIVEDVLSVPDAEAYAAELFANSDGVVDYRGAVSAWLMAGVYAQQVHDAQATYPEQRRLSPPQGA